MTSNSSALLAALWLAAGLGQSELAAAEDATGLPSNGAAAAPIDDPSPDTAEASRTAQRKPLGLMFDLGSMHGAMLSLAYRPMPGLRLHAGAGTNAVSPGYRAGVTVATVGSGPSLNIEGGHFLPGDMNGLLKALVGTGYRANPRLEHFDYDFVNVHAGWELESGNLIFFARGGVTLLWTTIPKLPTEGTSGTSRAVDSEPFGLALPSVAFGFIGLL